METVQSFAKELDMINSGGIKAFTRICLERAPMYFYEKPSSSTGKYHPAQSNGEGGLVRHSRAVAYFAKELCPVYGFKGRDADQVISAAILHDILKYGPNGGNYTTKTHDKESADFVMAVGKDVLGTGEVPDFNQDDLVEICRAIAFHMGPWCVHEKAKPFSEFTAKESLVHIADMVSSRKEVSLGFLGNSVGIG